MADLTSTRLSPNGGDERDEDQNPNNNNNSSSEKNRREQKKQKVEESDEEVEADEEEEEDEGRPANDNQRSALIHNLLNAMIMGRYRGTSNTNEELIENLKSNGVLTSTKVEEALLEVPRGWFVPKDLEDEAYEDNPLRVASMGFNISAPHMYAMCLEALKFQLGNSFLDVGSGCGHFTALGSRLVGKDGLVHGLDLRDDIVNFSKNNLKKAADLTGIDFSNVTFYVRNCFLPTAKPRTYDRIHVGACCPDAQVENLYKLLAPNGILVTPKGDKLVKVTKDEEGKVTETSLLAVRYGDLIVPSEAEIKEAYRQAEHEKAATVVVPDSTFQGDFLSLLNNQKMSDVTIIVEGKEIYAHKVILAARSEHFAAMFYGGLRETRENRVEFPDLPYSPFMDCLKYMYSDIIVISSPDHAIEVLSVANYIKLDRLKALCESIIRNSIEIENAAYILSVSSRYAAWQLKSFALDYIMQHYEEVSQTKTFDDLDKGLLLEVTKAACKLFKA